MTTEPTITDSTEVSVEATTPAVAPEVQPAPPVVTAAPTVVTPKQKSNTVYVIIIAALATLLLIVIGLMAFGRLVFVPNGARGFRGGPPPTQGQQYEKEFEGGAISGGPADGNAEITIEPQN
jgi:hypothetical protein